MKITHKQMRVQTHVKSGVEDKHLKKLCADCHAKCQTKLSDFQAQCHKACGDTLPKCNTNL